MKFLAIFHKIFSRQYFFLVILVGKYENKKIEFKFCIFKKCFFRKIGFQRKSWIETHIKSHILDIMDQKSTCVMSQFWTMTTPWKKNNNFISPFRDSDWFLIYIDKKQLEISPKPVSSDENSDESFLR